MISTIRTAVPTDASIIFDFIRQLAEYERMTDEVVTNVDQIRAHLFPASGDPIAHCLLAFESNKPVGFALYFYNFSTFLGRPGIYLEDLFVSPHHRGQGHGKAMLRALATVARDRDCGRLEWCVLDWNQSAIDFYQSLGATMMSEWTTCRLNRAGIAQLAG
ncbi:GNAT family N-acetyltransferase [Synoicihabitans lomoniglobus]|uniref:GNAT family N-acetyltransferase n=1 Tax=Synoicihabitans lomoniglobus TaxID=2909285 RepID=A0AAF0A1G6_9BACT|nr:GNAT family N-acetyltransferase [Opitutaceae bacterium LMO-M01]WED65758.1 GNAT family N-acetyltransferase [Opitutaceae bacterium LMO-M01]